MELKGARTMNSQSQRSIFNDPADEAELVTPLSGPSYGPYVKARRRWHKPLPAIIADAIANNQALLTRLERGMYCPPDLELKPHCEEVFNALFARTREQLAALRAFNAIDWRE
jgi:hypothetical protein